MTCSDGGGSSSPASRCSRSPRWPAGSRPNQPELLIARVVQGIGGAFAAPASLSLIAVTFPEGKERNRAMGVYAAVSIAGAAIGLIAGGLLTSYADWRWVFFVNVPIGLVLVLLAPRVLRESERVRGRFDLPGAITGSLGLGALVYGLSEAATTFTNGQAVGHWGSTKVIVSLVAAVVLLGAFAFIEARSKHALVPPRVLALPRQDRGVPDQPVHRHGRVRHVLLHDDLRADGLALLAGPLGDRVPADGRLDHGRGRRSRRTSSRGSARGR